MMLSHQVNQTNMSAPSPRLRSGHMEEQHSILNQRAPSRVSFACGDIPLSTIQVSSRGVLKVTAPKYASHGKKLGHSASDKCSSKEAANAAFSLDDLQAALLRETSTVRTEEPQMDKSDSEIKAEELLGDICKAREYQMEQEKSYETSIKEQHELAYARFKNQNMFGARMCIKKVEKIRAGREKIRAAISTLEFHVIDIECKLSRVYALKTMHGNCTDFDMTIDIDEHLNYQQEVKEILALSPLPPPVQLTETSSLSIMKELILKLAL